MHLYFQCLRPVDSSYQFCTIHMADVQQFFYGKLLLFFQRRASCLSVPDLVLLTIHQPCVDIESG